MMRGNNELHVNEATMIEALQEWLDNRVLVSRRGTSKVTSVHEDPRNSYGGRIFIIKTEEAKTDAPQG